jgi:streptomycin 6-kinase
VGRLEERFLERLGAWQVEVERSFQTEGSMIALGNRGEQRVVVKVLERGGDEWNSGAILEAFDGHGMVRVYDYIEGAMLLERLEPGSLLTGVVLEGADEAATEIIADVMQRMTPGNPPPGTPTALDLAKGFALYRASGDVQIPRDLFEDAERIYLDLAATQRSVRLIHGDLQHYNVLLDSERGWLAIDPKGIVAELEYEIGASMRNPFELAQIVTAPSVIERRIRQYTSTLNLDSARVLKWAFSQAVLSAIWSVEDGYSVRPDSVAITLAYAIAPMLDS